MRRLLIISALIFAALLPGAAQVSSSSDGRLGEKLEGTLREYLLAIDRLEIPEAMKETDFLIESVQDSVTREAVAQRAYRHFRESPLMGAEGVAIHIFDRWFAEQNLLMEDVDAFEEARFHAYVNRRSLIGCKAEDAQFLDMNGRVVTLPSRRRASIIYFYSADCPKCLKTSKELSALLEGLRPAPDVYFVYTGDDEAQWRRYVAANLSPKKFPKCRLHQLCAGSIDSQSKDYVLKYGVVQAPRLFMTDKHALIIGRALDTPALRILLQQD